MTPKSLDIISRLKNQADLALEEARKVERDEDFTGIEATQDRFYQEGYRDGVAEVLQQLLRGGE